MESIRTFTHEHGKVRKWVHEGKVIYQSSVTLARSVSVLQAQQPNTNANTDFCKVPDGFTKLTIKDFVPGKSYGETQTGIAVVRGGSVVAQMRWVSVAYTGSEHKETQLVGPVDTVSVQPGDVVQMAITANYNPNVSQQFTSTAKVKYVFE